MPRVKALIWDYFSICEDSDRFACCTVCKDRVSRGGSSVKSFNTTNLIDHLKKKHSGDYTDYEEKKRIRELKEKEKRKEQTAFRQLTMIEAETKVKVWDINDPHAMRIHKLIGEMIATDNQPFSVVHDTGFSRLIKALEPRYVLPSRKYFSETIVPDIKDKVNAKLAEMLVDVPYLSLTTDIWSSSSAQESLISLTAHWVTQEFNRVSAVLHAHRFEGSHTGEYICEKLEDMLKNWGINKTRVHLIIHDNASNMKKASREAQLPSMGCFAHTLQLVVNEGVLSQRAVIDILAISRKIVGHFKHSTLAYHRLNEIQDKLSMDKHRLVQDEPTRWNSTLYMLQSIYTQKMALAAYTTEYDSISMLTTHQLELVRKIIAVLEPVEEITKLISTDTASASVLIPLLRALEKSLSKHHDDSGIQTMKSEMLSSLKRRFADVEEHKELIIATTMDPRYKDKFFSNSTTKVFVKQLVVDICTEMTESSDGPPNKRQHLDDSTAITTPNSANTSKVWECMAEILEDSGELTDHPSVVGEIEGMVNNYLKEPLISYQVGNPYLWWNNNRQRYPMLAKVASRYLSAPPTSVSSERVFSGAGNIYDDHRCRLNADKAEMLLVIKYNLKVVGYKY